MLNSENIKANLGAVVKELRNLKGITQDQLSENIELDVRTITKIETGRSFVSSDVLAKLCNFFEVNPSIFFSEKPVVMTKEKLDYIHKIKQILPEFDNEKLEEIYNILLVMKK